jgi:15-cis-phytoene synthase/lycopene beta-cyclase
LSSYSFCRVADDLVDNAESEFSARTWISKLIKFLDQSYTTRDVPPKAELKRKVKSNSNAINDFPPSSQSALSLLPTPFISSKPLYDLLAGFKTDLEFPALDRLMENAMAFPIKEESDLELYASRVAGTIAELCLELVFHHSPTTAKMPQRNRERMVNAGGRMGIALQCVNIARDVATDAAIGRVYLPTSWLEEEGLSPQDVIDKPRGASIERLRTKLLGKAFIIYEEARSAMAHIPPEARAPMRVAVESYMEIGRVLGEKGYKTKAGKATVPKLRRIRVAWKALKEG